MSFSKAPKVKVEGDGRYNDVFLDIPISSVRTDIDNSGSVITINSDTSVADAVAMLAEHHCSSAPVRNVKAADSAPWTEKYLGCIDFLVVINWLMDGTWGHAPDSLEALRYHKRRFQKTLVGELLDYVRVAPFIPVYESNTNFLDLMLLLGKFQVRRVYRVESPNGDINGVLSQSAIVDVLAQNMSRFPSISQKSIVELGLGAPCNVISVDLHDTYWDAFRTINANYIYAVPILDDDGCLVGNISARDVKNMVLEPVKFAMMSKPIGEFLTKGIDLFTCKETDSLEAIVHKFQASRVRTLYVVDASNKPTSVVAICDLLAVFVKEPEVNWSKFQDFFDASWPAVSK